MRRRRGEEEGSGDRRCVVCGSFRVVAERHGRWRCLEHQRWRHLAGVTAIVVNAAGFTFVSAVLLERPLLASVLLTLPALVAVTVAHEGAHVLAGAAVGLRVGEVNIGAGPRVATFGTLPRRLVLRLLPVGGFVEAAPRGDPRTARWRLAWAAFAAAGPLASAAFVVAGVRHGAPPFLLAAGGGAAYLTFNDLLGALSRKTRARNDFWGIVARLRRAVPVTVDTPTGWSLTTAEVTGALDAVMGVTDGRYDRVTPAIDLLLTAQPGTVPWTQAKAAALVETRDYAAARAVLASLDVGDDERRRAVVLNHLAWVDALTGTHADEMREAVEGALAQAPDDPSFLGTAALAAARDGRLDEAEALCDRAAAGLTLPWLVAMVEATRAYVAHRRGDAVAARALAERARRLDPHCVVLRLLEPAEGDGRARREP